MLGDDNVVLPRASEELAPKLMQEKCVVLLFYERECRFHEIVVSKLAVLWTR